MLGDVIPARRAEEIGLINHCVPDDELDAFVDELATAKRLVNERSAPAREGELLQSFKSILEAIRFFFQGPITTHTITLAC